MDRWLVGEEETEEEERRREVMEEVVETKAVTARVRRGAVGGRDGEKVVGGVVGSEEEVEEERGSGMVERVGRPWVRERGVRKESRSEGEEWSFSCSCWRASSSSLLLLVPVEEGLGDGAIDERGPSPNPSNESGAAAP